MAAVIDARFLLLFFLNLNFKSREDGNRFDLFHVLHFPLKYEIGKSYAVKYLSEMWGSNVWHVSRIQLTCGAHNCKCFKKIVLFNYFSSITFFD